MSNKRMNKRIEICLIVVAACIVVSALWTILAMPEAAFAAKPGTIPVCIDFEAEGGIQSDDGTPYCDDKRLKVEAIMTQDGHVNLKPNTDRSNRTLYVDVDFNPDNPGVDIISTEGWRFIVGCGQDNFDMRAMNPGEVRDDANLRINLEAPPNNENIANWLLTFDPSRTPHDDINYSDSTYVTVTRGEDPYTDTWTIEVDDADRAVLVLHELIKNKSEFIYGGLVTVPPFTATVTLIP